jgi:hypothetical protein
MIGPMDRVVAVAIALTGCAGCGRVGFDAPGDGLDAIAAGLVAHWKLDETGGMTAMDSAGTANGTLTNMDPLIAWVSGHPGTHGGLELDGVDDLVALPTLAVTRGSYTISFWVKLYDWANNTVDNAWSAVLGPEDAWQWIIMVNHAGTAGRLSHYGKLDGDNDHFVAGYLDWGTWYHAALVSDGSTSRWYLDGAPVAVSTRHDSSYGNIAVLGSRYTGASATVRFKGVLDDVRVYDRVLSAAEIGDLYRWTE